MTPVSTSVLITFAHGATIQWSPGRYGENRAAAERLMLALRVLTGNAGSDGLPVESLAPPSMSPKPSLRWLDENINVMTPCLPGRVQAALEPVLEHLKATYGFTLPATTPATPFLTVLDEFFKAGSVANEPVIPIHVVP